MDPRQKAKANRGKLQANRGKLVLLVVLLLVAITLLVRMTTTPTLRHEVRLYAFWTVCR